MPITRNLPGACTAVFSLFLVASGRMEPHHTCAKLRKNSCLPVTLIPGNVSSSSSFRRSHLSYACKNCGAIRRQSFNSVGRTGRFPSENSTEKSSREINYSERLLDAAVVRDVLPLRVHAVYLHTNLRDGVACVLIC